MVLRAGFLTLPLRDVSGADRGLSAAPAPYHKNARGEGWGYSPRPTDTPTPGDGVGTSGDGATFRIHTHRQRRSITQRLIPHDIAVRIARRILVGEPQKTWRGAIG